MLFVHQRQNRRNPGDGFRSRGAGLDAVRRFPRFAQSNGGAPTGATLPKFFETKFFGRKFKFFVSGGKGNPGWKISHPSCCVLWNSAGMTTLLALVPGGSL